MCVPRTSASVSAESALLTSAAKPLPSPSPLPPAAAVVDARSSLPRLSPWRGTACLGSFAAWDSAAAAWMWLSRSRCSSHSATNSPTLLQPLMRPVSCAGLRCGAPLGDGGRGGCCRCCCHFPRPRPRPAAWCQGPTSMQAHTTSVLRTSMFLLFVCPCCHFHAGTHAKCCACMLSQLTDVDCRSHLVMPTPGRMLLRTLLTVSAVSICSNRHTGSRTGLGQSLTVGSSQRRTVHLIRTSPQPMMLAQTQPHKLTD